MKKKLFSVLSFLMLLVGMQAQVANYTFAKTTGVYTPITGGTALWTATFDDQVSTAITIPSFTFNGAAYTQVYVSANGFITFGSVPSGTNYTPISSAATYSGAISALACDIAQAAAGSPEVRYETIGNEFIVQWQDVRRRNNTGERISFQIRLNTSTNAVDIVYGGTIVSGSTQYGREVGLRGTTNTFATNVNNLTIDNVPTASTCNWTNVVTGNANSSTLYFYNTNTNVVPVSGLTFSWAPPVNAALAPIRTFTAVTGIATTSANIGWTAPTGATQYNVQYRTPGTCGWTNFSGNPVLTNSLALTGLTPATVYQIRVQSTDGTNNSIWSHIPNTAGTGNGYSATGTFSTLATCPAPTSGTVTAISSNSAVASWTAGATETAWDIFYGPTPLTAPDATTVPTATTSTNSYTLNGLNPVTGYAVYVRANCGSGDASLWIGPRNFTTTALATDLQTSALTAPAVNPTGCYGSSIPVIIQLKNAGSTTLDFSINNATVITSITGTNPQTFTTTVNTGTLAANATTNVTVTSTYNMSALGVYTINASSTLATPDANTANDAMVAVTRTTSGPVALPQLVNFTGYLGTAASLSTSFPGWFEGAGAVTPAIGTDGFFYYTNSTAQTTLYGAAAKMNLYNSNAAWIISPKVVPTAAHVFKYKAALVNYDGTTAVNLGTTDTIRAMVSTNCGATWTALRTFNSTSNQGLNNTTNVLREYSESLSAYAGQEIMVAIYARRGVSSTTPDIDVVIDDVQIDLPPACPAPTGLTISAITPTTATATWTVGATETAWDVYYGVSPVIVPTATTVATATTSVNSYSFTSLTPSTGYGVYVRANCGAGNTSLWTPLTSFATPCLPADVSGTGNSRCGTGTTTLTATSTNTSAVFQWYTAPTGGAAIATGSVFTTPTISANTNYYVSSTAGYTEYHVGPLNNTAAISYFITNDWGITFDAASATTLKSVAVYPGSAGTVTISVQNNAAGSIVFGTYVATFTSGQVGTKVVLPLNVAVPAGTGYKVLVDAYSSGFTGFHRESTTGFPFTTPGSPISLTSSEWSGTTTSTFYFFYDFVAGAGCESPRALVTATVTPAPALSVTSGTTICTNAVQSLSVTSTVADYDSYIWTPSTNLYTDAAATTAYTGGTATTLYYSSSAVNNTTYTITANNSVSGCDNSTSTSMMATMPAIYASANPTLACVGSTVALNATTDDIGAGLVNLGTGNLTTSGSGAAGGSNISPFSHYFGGYKGQYIIRASELTAAGLYAGNITSLSYSVTSVGTTYNNFAIGIAATTQSVANTSFNGSIVPAFGPSNSTPTVGLNTYNFATPFNWDGMSNIVVAVCWSNNNTGGTASEVRYNTTTFPSTSYMRDDNVSAGVICGETLADGTSSNRPLLIFGGQTNTPGVGTVNWTWNPGAIPTNTAVVTPTGTGVQSYTVTALDPANTCTNSAVVTVTVNAAPTVSATASSTLVCSNLGETSILTGNASAGTYSWSTNETTSVITVTPNVGTTYTLTATDNGCSATTTIFVDAQVCTGINNIVAANSISVYPNPTNGIVNISISAELAGATSIEVYDAIGKLVIKEALTKDVTTVNTSKLTDGIYIYKIINASQPIKVGRIVKQ